MKQRIYLPTEYAEILARNAAAVGVSPDLYIQTLITQDHICGLNSAPGRPAPQVQPAPEPGIVLSGEWGAL